MKAYKVYVKYAMSYSIVVEEIEVDRMTEKSYYQGSRPSRRLTDYEVVFATMEGAVEYAKKTTQDKIIRVQAELDRLQTRLATIESMEVKSCLPTQPN